MPSLVPTSVSASFSTELRVSSGKRTVRSKCPVAFVDLCGGLAADGDLDNGEHVSDIHAVARDLVAVDADADVRLPGNPLHHHVLASADFAQHLRHFIGFGLQNIHVLAKQLQDQLRAGSGHQLVDAALDRLAEGEGHPGDICQRIPHLVRELFASFRGFPFLFGFQQTHKSSLVDASRFQGNPGLARCATRASPSRETA